MTRPKWLPFHAMIMTFPWHDYDYFTLQILFFAWQNLYFWRISGFWVTSSLELGRGLEGSYRILKDLSRILKDLEGSCRIFKCLARSWMAFQDLEGLCRILNDCQILDRSLNPQKCDWVTEWVSEWVTGPDLERLVPLKMEDNLKHN